MQIAIFRKNNRLWQHGAALGEPTNVTNTSHLSMNAFRAQQTPPILAVNVCECCDKSVLPVALVQPTGACFTMPAGPYHTAGFAGPAHLPNRI